MTRFSWILLFGAIAGSTLSTPAWTQTEPEVEELSEDIIELQTMTCREVLKSEGENRDNIMIFMHGYISGKKGETTVDAPVLADVTNQILDSCIDSPDQTLFSVFEASR